MNNESSIQEATIASYYAQKGATQKIITSEVVAGYQNLKRAKVYREKASTHAEIQNKYNIEFIERIGNAERHRSEKIRFEIAKNTAKTNENRLDAERAYNKALMQLEKALGSPLGKVFTTGKQKKVISTEDLGLQKKKTSSQSFQKDSTPESKEKSVKKKWKFPFFQKVQQDLPEASSRSDRKKR